LIAMLAQQGDFNRINEVVNELQGVFQAMRYAPKPVVSAPFGMALGGGAEAAMAGRIVATRNCIWGWSNGVGLLGRDRLQRTPAAAA
jgi:3-hydroxyacyl-CoA dehydrogenase